MEVISETGLIGLFLLCTALAIYVNRYLKNSISSNNIAFFLLAMLLPIKPSGALFSTWFGTLIWILMGFSMLKKINYEKKIALITGITGQDGSYLSRFLLKKNYIVHGIQRRSSSINTKRIDDLYQDPHSDKYFFKLHYGDMTDSLSLLNLISKIRPDEIYNLAAQSHVAVSFEEPEYTANSDALGTLRLLEAIRLLNLQKKQSFTKLELQKCLVKFKKIHKVKKHHFILEAHME